MSRNIPLEEDLVDLVNYEVSKSFGQKRWPECPIAVFDVETTDVEYTNFDTFAITQFAMGIYNYHSQDQPTKYIEFFINPEMKVQPGALKITQHYHKDYNTDEELQEAQRWNEKKGKEWNPKELSEEPPFEFFADEILEAMFQAELWCAYNHRFDVNALASMYERLGMEFSFQPTLDPLVWERDRREKMSGNSLWNIAKRFGAKVSAAKGGDSLHDARTDIELLNAVVWKIQPKLPLSVAALLKYQLPLMESQEEYLYNKYS